MKKILGILLVVLFFSACQTEKKEIIKIGAILPLTGETAQWGIPPKKGAEIAVEEINAKGGINGKKIKLIIEDSSCDPRQGAAAMNKLISTDKPVAVVGAVCSSVTLAIAPIAEKNKTVLISPASTNPQITNAGDYIFRIIPSDELRGKVFADFIISEGLTKGSILYINNEGGKGNMETFKKYFTMNNGDIVNIESYSPQATNVKTQLIKIKEKQVEFLMVVSYLKDAITVLKDIKEVDLSIPVFFQTEALDDPTVLYNAGKTAENVTYISYADVDNSTSNLFKEAYNDKFNMDPELFAAEAYDAIYLIVKAIEQNVNLKSYLYQTRNYEGASGKLSFDQNGDIIKPFAIKKINNSKPNIIKII